MISSSCTWCTASTNPPHHRPYQTNRTGDSGGLRCGSGPNVPKIMKRDRPETILPTQAWVPATEVVNRLNSSSSKQLHSHPLISYSCDATKTVAPGIRPSLPSKEENWQSNNVTHVESSSCKAVIQTISPD